MKCQQIQAKMVAYSENLVDPKIQFQIETHVRTCPDCAQELREIESTLKLLREPSPPEPSDMFWREMTANIMRKVRNTSPPTPTLFQLPRARFIMTIVSLLILILGVWGYFARHAFIADRTVTQSEGETTVTHTAATGTPDLHQIAPEELAQQMLESEFALFDGATAPTFDLSASEDLVDVWLSGLTLEEKQALLAELDKLKESSQATDAVTE